MSEKDGIPIPCTRKFITCTRKFIPWTRKLISCTGKPKNGWEKKL